MEGPLCTLVEVATMADYFQVERLHELCLEVARKDRGRELRSLGSGFRV